MTTEMWRSAKRPPDNSRTVTLHFGDDGERDCDGFYWAAEGCWYRSQGSKARRNAVHPVSWSELIPGPVTSPPPHPSPEYRAIPASFAALRKYTWQALKDYAEALELPVGRHKTETINNLLSSGRARVLLGVDQEADQWHK